MFKKIGILGGGQLGKMLCQAGAPGGYNISVLDESSNFPAGHVTSKFFVGNFRKKEDVLEFGKKMDILTIEIEDVHTGALKELEDLGISVFPQPHLIEMIKDKGKQKTFYRINSLPTATFRLVENKDEIVDALKRNTIKYPFVQKIRTGGYDGRGVQVVHHVNELSLLMEGPSVIENKVDIKKELSVIVAVNGKGDIRSFPVVEMMFHPSANLVEYLFSPSEISVELAEKATLLAEETANKMGIQGLLAVEMFLDSNDQLLINEVAPRPHNSGHHTIEAHVTSQYEQHLRAISGLPLGSTKQQVPALMFNLLGEAGFEGPVRYEGIEECLSIEGVHIHIYGKAITKPFRKMGHVTITGPTLDKAREVAFFIKKTLKVKSK
ncbi:MAG TPA: 5-(carboxyamino)imidazole ribonucleotide synthase [Saprospiraceae bacterium]|nr:5-(carboxyamino)imidazole ribonucleotide synthase [Saprospiraceae bacterium]